MNWGGLGSVSYLNAKPLLWGLDARLATPRQLAAWLRAGELEAALVPVVEAMEHAGYWLVDGIAIGCDGPVYSVFLALEKPLHLLRRVALDPASKTSVQLARWLLDEHLGLDITYVDPTLPADARLIIGDPAIAFRQTQPETPIVDLGEAWKNATGLPFVFAVWALRSPDSALADRLRHAAAAGLLARPEIAHADWQREYLTRSIRYELGDRQKAALTHFAHALHYPWSPRWI